VAKLGVVEEEADECAFWMELIIDGGIMQRRKVEPLRDEAEQLTRIFAASKLTTRRNNRKLQIETRKSS
jgi:hypothetical protein